MTLHFSGNINPNPEARIEVGGTGNCNLSALQYMLRAYFPGTFLAANRISHSFVNCDKSSCSNRVPEAKNCTMIFRLSTVNTFPEPKAGCFTKSPARNADGFGLAPGQARFGHFR